MVEATRTGVVVVCSNPEDAVEKLNLQEARMFNDKLPFNVEAAREIRRTASVSTDTIRRFVIKQQRAISEDAQNVLLKTLEDGVKGLQVVFVVESADLLLKTVISRCQLIDLKRTSHKGTFDEYMHLARGNSSDAARITVDATLQEEAKLSLENAKKFLQSDSEQRISMLKDYQDAETTNSLVSDLLYISEFIRPGANTLKGITDMRFQIGEAQNNLQLIGSSLKLIHSRLVMM